MNPEIHRRQVFEFEDLEALLHLFGTGFQPKKVSHAREFSLYQKIYLLQKMHKIFTMKNDQQACLRDQGLSPIRADR